jgi:hypothetical protein
MSVNVAAINSSFWGESDSWTNAFGLRGGVAVNIPINSGLPITTWVEGNISMQGARYEDDWGEGPVEGLTRLTYLNFPLFARYPLNNQLYVDAGIQPGILLSAKDKVGGESWDYKDWVNTFDLSVPLGIGYDFKNNVGVGVRVIPGLTNINSGGDYVSRDRNFVVALRGTYTLTRK